MDNTLKFTLDVIRNDDVVMHWLEERKLDWVPVVTNAINSILEGKTIVLITDQEREWFAEYIMSTMNKPSLDRPILPIVRLDKIYAHFDDINTGEKIDILDDMLSMSYKDDFFFWYIGKGNNKRADIAKRNEESFLWIMDEEIRNGFFLKSYDNWIEIKLLHLYRLFDKTLNAALFGEIDLSI